MKKEPSVAVIILNWNDYDNTVGCLNSLKKSNYKNYKVVLVDNDSKNNEGKRLKKKFPYIHLIQNRINRGFAGGNNDGINWALKKGFDYVWLLNNDTYILSDTLRKLIENSNDNSISSPIIYYFDKKNKIWSAGIRFFMRFGLTFHLRKVKSKPDFFVACSLLIPKKLINDVGMLDEIYFVYLEDMDYCYRAKQKGYEMNLITTSKIFHKVSSSTQNDLRKFFLKTSSLIYFMQKWNLNGFLFTIGFYFIYLPMEFRKYFYHPIEFCKILLKIKRKQHGVILNGK